MNTNEDTPTSRLRDPAGLNKTEPGLYTPEDMEKVAPGLYAPKETQ
ncbi:hypothetical protein M4D51_02470 [Microbacterium sp. p3-SID338]|nr:hypothetical protein [Microbacterium sp. p3-SID338]MCT1394587.1 hypothetical protein [Microbacterium sp. p3-SID338]